MEFWYFILKSLNSIADIPIGTGRFLEFYKKYTFDIYGVDITDDDKVNLNIIAENISKDEELKWVMQGDNSEINKKNFFSQKCEDMIIDDIENSAELYKKISSDEPVKNFIFKLLYENYQRNLKWIKFFIFNNPQHIF